MNMSEDERKLLAHFQVEGICKLLNGDSSTPPPTSSPEDFINCDFQDGLCNWHIDEELNVTDRFHFERRNGDENLGALMRPDSDHNGDRKSRKI